MLPLEAGLSLVATRARSVTVEDTNRFPFFISSLTPRHIYGFLVSSAHEPNSAQRKSYLRKGNLVSINNTYTKKLFQPLESTNLFNLLQNENSGQPESRVEGVDALSNTRGYVSTATHRQMAISVAGGTSAAEECCRVPHRLGNGRHDM